MTVGLRLAKFCKQDMLHWARLTDDSSGRPRYAANPEALKCRWDDEMVNIIDKDGRTVTCNALIMSPHRILARSIVFLGTVTDWRKLAVYPKPPPPSLGGYEVVMTGHTPDIKGRTFLFTARV